MLLKRYQPVTEMREPATGHRASSWIKEAAPEERSVAHGYSTGQAGRHCGYPSDESMDVSDASVQNPLASSWTHHKTAILEPDVIRMRDDMSFVQN